MPAFGSSSKTGRLPPDKPRRDPSASSSSTKDEGQGRKGRSTKDARTKDRGGDVRAASRAPKPALAPATPSPTSHAPCTRLRAPVPPGRDPPPSARGSATPSRRSSPARTQKNASASAETKNASRVREGVTAVRNLLFEEGPKTYCAVDAPFRVSARHRGVSPTSSPIDPIDPIDASFAPDDALALALRIPADDGFVDASTLSSSSTRLAELRLADETWRRVAFRIARTGGARGDALAASAREVFRRLAAAMPPETSETKKKTPPPRDGVSFDAAGDVSPRLSSPRASRLLAPLLFDLGERESGSMSGSMSGPHSGLPRVRGLRFLGSRGFRGATRSSAATLARFALAALALVAVGAALASVAPLFFAAFHDGPRRRPTSAAFERDAPPPS